MPRLIHAAPQWPRWRAVLPPGAECGPRELGEVVAEHRSSWVRRFSTPLGGIFIKTYEYASWADRTRNFGRWTRPFAKSRARREFEALRWLSEHGIAGPEPLLAADWRRCGFLCRAVLITSADPGSPADALLAASSAADRIAIGQALGRFVHDLHALGFRDGNLDLRNLLVHRNAAGWRVAKIDSPRYRLHRRGAPNDRRARADWARLLPQLAPFGLADTVRAAAASAGTGPLHLGDRGLAGRPTE